ncbi:HAD family hydrolase [Paenibacillus paeoniae]|uniref:HAD family hydrolase n=1 Tax=Paenibacillus paeoniae TaxID=2292705 RepID=A0A371PIS5_9BACL|nr:HAD-IA family hydrolase [Paenibacillus paeoniae]REK76043.1 HAD family hydrolase [Paenibacillus paeoniae]
MRASFVWFDLGYTLVYQQREEAYGQFLRERGIELGHAEIERAYHVTDKLFMREYRGVLGRPPTTFMTWYLGVLNHQLGVSFNLGEQRQRLEDIQNERGKRWIGFPYAKSVLRELKERSVGVGLISNWDGSARQVLQDNELIEAFDHVVVSSEVGIEKPSPRIFAHALRLADVAAEECLYVGDNYYDDVIGSAKAGMDAVLINRFGQLGIEELNYRLTVPTIEAVPELLSTHTRRQLL